MIKKNILRVLLLEKRSYESLLALNAAGKHRSSIVDSMLNAQRQRVRHSIENLLKVKPQAQSKCYREMSEL